MERLQFDANGEVVSPYWLERISSNGLSSTLDKWLDVYDENELEG